MIALELTDVKGFMNTLLRSDCFDNFLLQEATITSGVTYSIDGRIPKGFYTEEELQELKIQGYPFSPFRLLRTNCFDLIKGKKTPSHFKFVFLLSPENLSRCLDKSDSSYKPEDISGVFLNLNYKNQLLTLTTGISYRIFSTDKVFEGEWDSMMKRFLLQHEIAFEELS